MGDALKATILMIAMACHQANKAWCEANGDTSQKDWNEAEEWQRESAIKGVAFRLENPNAGEDAQHNAWMKDKIADGWVYGEKKDPEAKTHNCLVPFDQLPEFQQKKDRLFCAVVDSLKDSGPRALSYGEEQVSLNFNPSEKKEVRNLKVKAAALIDEMHQQRKLVKGEKFAQYTLGIRNARQAQQWAVGAIFIPEVTVD